MEVRRITFNGDYPEPHLSIDCWPPFPQVNMFFRLAFQSYVQPYKLAVEVGKISEASAVQLLIKAYAHGVIAKCVTPGYETMKATDWIAFFTKYPGHFEELRSYCEASSNWESVDSGISGADHGEKEQTTNS